MPSRKRAKGKAENHELSDAAIGTDLAAMLEETKPDAVFDCAIPEAHCEITLAALERGCHVLGEKIIAGHTF